MAGPFLKGALISFTRGSFLPVPTVIVFQYNAETMTHSWTQPEAAPGSEAGAVAKGNPLAVSGMPGESFSFTIAMDSDLTVAEGAPPAQAVAMLNGIYPRLAALEMLLYPVSSGASGGLVGTVSAAAAAAGAASGSGSAGTRRSIPPSQMPAVLFVWGPNRILPVRVTGLTITEQLYDTLLNPVHAEAQLSLRVLTPEELQFVTGPLSDVAQGAYSYSQRLRVTLAAANLINAGDDAVGMLPF